MKRKRPPDHAEDAEEEAVLTSLVTSAEDVADGRQPVCARTIKMKLRTFLKDQHARQLTRALDAIVRKMNRVMGEAYAFANLHIAFLLQRGVDLPAIDRNLYYRCLRAVTTGVGTDSILRDMRETIALFDSLRTGDAQEKVDVTGCLQVLADLSISMATMATNHLWMNLDGRLLRYLKWRHPGIKGHWATVVRAVVQQPKDDLSILFPSANQRCLEARRVAEELRKLAPLPSSMRYNTRAHLVIPLYARILQDTVEARRTQEADILDNPGAKRRRYRTFTILPVKGGYTASYVPISTMTFLGILKRLKLESFKGDGRHADWKAIWGKYCNVSGVETRNCLFDGRILTDGYAVSVLMAGLSAATCRLDTEPPRLPAEAIIKGIDPGFTDVVTVAGSTGETWSYSSGRYYERAKFNHSRRRTDAWNVETEGSVSRIPTPHTVHLEELKVYTAAYIAALPGLLEHRLSRGYRQMRLLRYCFRKKAVQEICDMVVPKSAPFVYVGFGDWSGGSKSPMSRRTSGPLQEIRFELRRRTNAWVGAVDEFRTSKVCSCCGHKLCNMRAETTSIKRNGERVAQVRRIHQVLHCRNSDTRSSGRCGTTWNRDVNAARNLLDLVTRQLRGEERPPVFCRPVRSTRGDGEGRMPRALTR